MILKRRGLTFLCIVLAMCVIVGLQLANHFVMLRKQECVCANGRDQPRVVNEDDDDRNPPAARLRTFDAYVDGLLDVLAKMNEVQKADLGTNFAELNEVLNNIKDAQIVVKPSRTLSEKRPSNAAEGAEIQEICPEKFLGESLTYGYPFFRKGFATLNCTQFIPIKDLVTVVFDDVYTTALKPPAYERVLKGLAKYQPDANVVYMTKTNPTRELTQKIKDLKSNVKVVHVLNTEKLGKMWSDSLAHVTTKYVLIAPNLVEYDDDVNLKRLVRILSHNPDVVLASGAYRTRDGHWDIDCEQTIFRNFTMTMEGGYYLSFWECVVCDYVPGPWVARTEELKKLTFDESLNYGAFHDLFMKLKHQKRISVSCPDVMFNIDKPKVEDDQYVDFAAKHDIKKIVEPNGRVRWYGCRDGIGHKTGGSCSRRRGLGVPPCDLENLADAVKLIMRECENAGLFCELQEGTLLGAVKFNKVLPWERDADLTFLTANYTEFKKLASKFNAAGYSLTPHDDSIWCCADGRKAGGKFSMTAGGWSIELYGQHLMESEMLVARGEAPTKVDFAGQMVTVMRNPGLFARNRYGKSIYRHQEHWLDRGKTSGWHFYNPGKFEGCPTTGHSGCLSQYSVDGNMQFDRNICPCSLQSSREV